MPWLFWKKKKPIDKVIEKTIKNIEKIKGVDKDLKKAREMWLREYYKWLKVAEIYAEKASTAKSQGNEAMYKYYREKLREALVNAQTAEIALRRLRVPDKFINEIITATGVMGYMKLIEDVVGMPLDEFTTTILDEYHQYLAKIEEAFTRIEAVRRMEEDILKGVSKEADEFIASKMFGTLASEEELEKEVDRWIEAASKKKKKEAIEE